MNNLSLAIFIVLFSSVVFAQMKTNAKPNHGYEPLLWEQKGQYEKQSTYENRLKRSPLWTLKVYEVIRNETKLVESNPEDAEFYCPNYKKLNKDQRANFWGQMIAAISFRESGWSPTNRYKEPREDYPKGDVVTGSKDVWSEGLMQLSYQDMKSYSNKFDCQFDWSKDKKLKPDDPNKTILAPYRNLRCGILILNNQVKNNNKITTKGVYWSVLRPRTVNKYSKTLWIAKQTQKLSFCGKSRLVQNSVAK